MLAPKERKHNYAIQRDVETAEDLSFLAPPSWAFTTVPESCFYQGEFGIYAVNFTVKGRHLTASRFLLIPAADLKPWQAKTLLTWVEACKQQEKQLNISMSKLTAIAPGMPTEVCEENRTAIAVDRRPFYLNYGSRNDSQEKSQ